MRFQMKENSLALTGAVTVGLILVVIIVAACAPPGVSGARESAEPTITAIMLPTYTPAGNLGDQPELRNDDEPVTEATSGASTPAAVSGGQAGPETSVPGSDQAPEDKGVAGASEGGESAPAPDATAGSPTAAVAGPAEDTGVAPEPTETPSPPTPATETAAAERRQPETTKVQASKAKAAATAAGARTGRLAFQTSSGGDIYIIDANGQNLQQVTDGVDPAWSPSGSQLAVTRWREPRGVWTVSIDREDGLDAEQHLFTWNEARWPTWSPDGQRILFSRQDGGKLEEGERCFMGMCFTIPARPHWRLGIVNVVDGTFSEPPGPDIAQAPDWSPDGSSVVYDGEQGIWVQALDGSSSYAITDNARDTTPVWSPDGAHVVFTRIQHDHREIYVVNADGSNVARLTTTPNRPDGMPGNSAAATWSPDGKHLAFLTDRSGDWEIWLMRANGMDQEPMFPTALDGLTLDYASIAERALSWTE